MSAGASLAEWVWESTSTGARWARATLAPASALFAKIVQSRNARFDAAIINGSAQVRNPVLPALSVGNLTVGGTGKTPIAAWCARELRKRGNKPAIVLRGYGDDEWRVHSLLNPGIPVVVAKDRLMGVAKASESGANCVVLDDAFQHRRAARLADIVLMSADRWTGECRLLPSGPFREPLSALRRATTVVITVKAANAGQVDRLERAILQAAPEAAISVVRLALGTLHLATMLPTPDAAGVMKGRKAEPAGMLDRPVEWLSGRNVMVVSAIGDPGSFLSQIEEAGALVTHKRFDDHHAFSAADAAAIARGAQHTDGVICTLKDAVKLGPIWPRVAPPLWYVSQQVVVERGASALDRALARIQVSSSRVSVRRT
ncbi:MAG: tetraacyldisaccharide 4'-kinase [Gemmatimonadaceae bacterium]